MTLDETLKYMESHLIEATIGGVQGQLKRLGMSDALPISQGQGNNLDINGVTVKGNTESIIDNIYTKLANSNSKEDAIKNLNAFFNQQKVETVGNDANKIPQIQINTNQAQAEQQTTALVSTQNPQQVTQALVNLDNSNPSLAMEILNQMEQKYPEFFQKLQQVPDFASNEELQNHIKNTEEAFGRAENAMNAQNQRIDSQGEAINQMATNIDQITEQLVQLQNQINNKPLAIESDLENNLGKPPASPEDFEQQLKYFNDKLTDAEARCKNLQNLVSQYANLTKQEGNPVADELNKGAAKINGDIDNSNNKSKNGALGKLGKGLGKIGSGLVKGANVLAGIAGSFIGNMAGGMGAAK